MAVKVKHQILNQRMIADILMATFGTVQSSEERRNLTSKIAELFSDCLTFRGEVLRGNEVFNLFSVSMSISVGCRLSLTFDAPEQECDTKKGARLFIFAILQNFMQHLFLYRTFCAFCIRNDAAFVEFA